jgi:hypothetical protein
MLKAINELEAHMQHSSQLSGTTTELQFGTACPCALLPSSEPHPSCYACIAQDYLPVVEVLEALLVTSLPVTLLYASSALEAVKGDHAVNVVIQR